MYNKIQERNSSVSKSDIEKERTIIADLQKTIAENDREIELLKCMVEYQVKYEQLKFLDCEKIIRHQICEKIREKLSHYTFCLDWENASAEYETEFKGWKAMSDIVEKVLIEIEQGESQC